SEVKSCNVDGSVGIPHVRVEHRRGFIKEKKPQVRDSLRFFVFCIHICFNSPLLLFSKKC
ncbi:hypothetical protein NUS43_09490, partial [Glaesserella parasuis]|nr:hypothetical protein [Glaesserella parasuis]